jgi:hypothetical protein
MSLYRQTGSSGWKAVVVAAVIALLVGGAIGYFVGRGSVSEPTLAEKADELRADVQPVLDGLSLVPDHYEQGLAAGGEVQFDGAVQQATFARDTFTAQAAGIRAISAERYDVALSELDELVDAMEARAAVNVIRRQAEAASQAVADAVGSSPDSG